jgi:oligogalacturonide lyase
MAIGDITKIGFAAARDPDTGVEVTRVTDDQADTIFPYFTQVVFTDDGQGLLTSSNRTGAYQAYVLNLERGELLQLSDEPDGINTHSSTVLPTKGAIAFETGRIVKRVNLDGSDTRALYEVPPGFRPSILAPASDGSSVTFAYSEQLELSTSTGRIYSTMAEHLYRRPASVIMRVDTESGAAAALWGEREWISHVNVSPVDPNIVVFCHEGSWHLVQRMWTLRASTGEVWPLVEQRRWLERSGHEFFTRTGRVVTQFSWRFHVEAKDWVPLDVFIDPDGGKPQSYRYLYGRPSHIQVAGDETLGAGDHAFPREAFGEGRNFIGLIRYQDERATMTALCRHDASWLTQHSHPHPVFSPDDRFVYFNSDRGGRCNVYRAPAAGVY